MNDNQSLTRIEPAGALDVQRPGLDLQGLFAQAIERGPEGVAVLKELIALREQMESKSAKRDFDLALAAFQKDCPPIAKTSAVHTKLGALAYSYAPFENILAIVKPVMAKHGLSFKLGTDTESKDGWVIATCTVTHVSGHSETSEAKFPLGAGTQIMSTTQVFAAALTFASRRVFCNSLGIVTGGEDLDGMGEKEKQKGPRREPDPQPESKPEASRDQEAKDLRKKLWTMLVPVRGTENNWAISQSWLRRQKIIGDIDMVSAMTAEQLKPVIDKAFIALEQMQ